ncbi:MAG: ABC transporter ATP-binding protein [Leptospiraceae bacterium]|nr:ABC transporter ATP-binding protein [Leptospiraceae bacterium]MCP5498264.1 ABC transporter ATP-binding protein [Leptospiraceae bacterium]
MLKTFRRLLAYSLRYRAKILAGVLFALLTALLNASSITALIPLFDSLGAEKKYRFQFELTGPEKIILYKEQIFGKDSLDGLQRIQKQIIRAKFWVNRQTKNMEPLEVIWAICKLIIPLYLLKLFTYLLSVYFIASTGYTAVSDIRQELFDKVQSLPLNYFYKEKSGMVMSRMINDIEVVAAVISSNLRDATVNFFYVITHLFVLLYLNAELLLLALITVPIIIYPVTLFTHKITKSTKKYQERMADLNGNIQEMISGIKIIRSFVTEKEELGKFQEINDKVSYRSFKGQFYLQMAPNLVELTSSVIVLFFFAFGAKLIFNGRFTQGEFMAFLLTLMFLLRPLTQLSQMVGKVAQASIAGERVFEILDMESEVKEGKHHISLNGLKDSIVFRDLHFTYPGSNQEVLKGINLEVKVGETIALVGLSGSGKSTLMDLIPRFYTPNSGAIEIDGVNIEELDISQLRKHIGVVTQDIFLFHGTVEENIAYGRPHSTRKEIMRAARLANAHDFIMEMENDYDSMLGIRGLNLSGGQRQRLVIARTLLRNPEILILDEATSALDSQSEKLVTRALDRLFENRTTFVIAHRLSTIRKIKKIVVLDKGQIAEIGDHDMLLAQNGIYARLYENQFAGAEVQV